MAGPGAAGRGFAAVRGAIYAVAFTALWAWVISAVRPLDERIGVSLPSWLVIPGGILMATGAALALACVAVFAGEGRGTPAPFDAPRDFVAVGPYRWLRNPMYLGAKGVMLGYALVIGSIAVIGVVVVFSLLTHLFVLAYEEPTLERRFGDSYRVYKQTVNRWLPAAPARR